MTEINIEKKSLKKTLISGLMTPDQYDFWCKELGTTAAWSRCFARVTSRTQEAEDTVSLTLKPNSNFAGFVPGQHVNLSAVIKGVRITRSYSFSNAPRPNGLIRITVRKEPNGLMSSWLHNEVTTGDVLELSPAFGEMTLQTNDKPLLFIAGGSGITPLMSLIEQALNNPNVVPTTLLYWDKTEKDFCFSEQLEALQNVHSHFSVQRITTRQAQPSLDLNTRLKRKQVKILLSNNKTNSKLDNYEIYCCGSHGFISNAKAQLANQGNAFYSEAFSPAPVQAVKAKEETFALTLARSGRTLEVSNQKPLLEQLEAQGITPESGCRTGICNTCSCTKLSGKSQHSNEPNANSENNASIRLCVSRAASDLTLDL